MWKANDQATKEFMRQFCTQLVIAKAKHIPFRQAQLDLKEKHSSPMGLFQYRRKVGHEVQIGYSTRANLSGFNQRILVTNEDALVETD